MVKVQLQCSGQHQKQNKQFLECVASPCGVIFFFLFFFSFLLLLFRSSGKCLSRSSSSLIREHAC